MRALCKDTARRYQTAAEMAADLRKTITHPKGGFVKYPQDGEPTEKPREPKKKRQQKERRERRRARALGTALAVVAALGAMLLAGWFFFKFYGRVEVPDVVGQQQSVALDMLDRSGLPAVINTAYSEEYDVGVVISQSEEAGERVRMGTGVELVVSAGSQWFYMADFIGGSEEEAMAALSTSGAKSITFEYVRNDEIEVGTVIAQSLNPGYQSKDEPVVITVSGQIVQMPTLTGLTLEGAQALIEAEGLVLGTVTQGYSADAVANTVIAQGIVPGSQVLKGTTVELTISQHGEVVYYPPARFTVVVPLDALSVEVRLIAPSGVEVTAYAGELSAGTYPIELSSSESGVHTVCVYLDGVPVDVTEVLFD